MEKLIVLRGIPGSGKTTFVEMVRKTFPALVHASADFIHMVGNEYRFDAKKLSQGHGLSFRTAIHAMQDRASMVIVDNTNTQVWEMSPYILAGQAYGYNTRIVRLNIDTTTAHARNIHGVPLKGIESMAERFQKPLPFWPDEERFTNPTQEQVDGFLRFWT